MTNLGDIFQVTLTGRIVGKGFSSYINRTCVTHVQIFLSKFRPPPPVFSKGSFHSPEHRAAGLQSLYLVTSRPVWLNEKGQREIERKLGKGVGRC